MKKSKKHKKSKIVIIATLNDLPAGSVRTSEVTDKIKELHILRQAGRRGHVLMHKLCSPHMSDFKKWPTFVDLKQAEEFLKGYRQRREDEKNPKKVTETTLVQFEAPKRDQPLALKDEFAPMSLSQEITEVMDRLTRVEQKLEKISAKQEQILTAVYRHMMTNQEVVG